jgi:hypothetical protein
MRPAHRASARPLALLAIGALLVLAACQNAASPSPSSGGSNPPSEAPSASPSPSTGGTGEIDHATGATDVIFRFSEGGGFVPMGFFATEAPVLTLYGDGTIIFRSQELVPDTGDGLIHLAPFKTAKLSEDQVQQFLKFAIADSGLGVSRASYDGPGADLPTATFTIKAGGLSKSTSVMALGMEREPGPDSAILKALGTLGEKLRDFSGSVDSESTWEPTRWRGVLTEDAPGAGRPWPWDDVAPADFVQHPEPDAPQFPVKELTVDQIGKVGVTGYEGGLSGIVLSKDGKNYNFAIRPLFPDEQF